MIRAKGKHGDTGREFYVFGLSRENIERLKDGDAIYVDASTMNCGASYPDVYIVYGETLPETLQQVGMLGHVDASTRVHTQERGDSHISEQGGAHGTD